MHRDEIVYPFTAVVGQEEPKQALLLNSVSHEVGGVLVRGSRGTAKSTLARSLAYLLPEIEVVTGCPFSCDPGDIESLCVSCAGRLAAEGLLPSTRSRMKIVTLPLNATEEMVVGTLDIERALRHGEKSFEPGILARANRSILYVDEVNLLEDHLVDILLDSAAMGVNVVEREGISFRHGARFILVGTMNPEEGDLRPQLEDRFGLCAEVENGACASDRAEILRRNMAFRKNPAEFEAAWHGEQEALRLRLVAARAAYPEVGAPDDVLEAAAGIGESSGADGHRADIAMVNAARALAALDGRGSASRDDVAAVSGLALNHRTGGGPLRVAGRRTPPAGMTAEAPAAAAPLEPAGEHRPALLAREESQGGGSAPAPAGGGDGPALGFGRATIPGVGQGTAPGRRGRPGEGDTRGRYYRSARPSGPSRPVSASDIAFDATLRASAGRAAGGDGGRDILPEDLRVKLRKRKCGASVIFVVDASASMGASQRLEAAREAVLALLVEAHQKRDRVGLVVFKDQAAELVLTPTSSKALAARLLSELAPGGATPLSHGLALGCRVLERELTRAPRPFPVLVLISDGGGNVTMGSSNPMGEALEIAREIRRRGISSVVLDSAPGSVLPGKPSGGWRLAEVLGGSYYPAQELDGEAILDRVDRSIARDAQLSGRGAP